MNQTDRNSALYKILNEMDDRRERIVKATSTGRHEPSSAFGGLYDVDEVDDGGRLIERRERSPEASFVPVSELPAGLKHRPIVPTNRRRASQVSVITRKDERPLVLRRRGSTLQAI